MFRAFGVSDIFVATRADFRKRWKDPVHDRFVSEKLDQIVNRRHVVAHSASALNISRADLTEALRFLNAFGLALERSLRLHVKGLIRAAR